MHLTEQFLKTFEINKETKIFFHVPFGHSAYYICADIVCLI